MTTVEAGGDVGLEVENVGGIDQTIFTFSRGVTVLTGRNATNRTSLLQAIMAALGSDEVSLKSDAERGTVRMHFDEETYTRELERVDDRVKTAGDTYLDDPTTADIFAFLLESNEARRAVRRGGDLRACIMRPVDTAAIREEIERLEAEKRRIDDELAELDSLTEELADLQDRRDRLTGKLETKRAELADERAALADLDASVGDSREQREELEETLSDVEDARSDLERTRTQLETERASIESLRAERSELTAELDDLPEAPPARLDDIDAELERLRAHKRSLDETINRLGRVIEFNESVLDGDEAGLLSALGDEGQKAVTDDLLPAGDDVVCWTCGSSVGRTSIEETLAELRSLREQSVGRRREVTADIEERQAERADLESVAAEREAAQDRLAEIETEIERREETVADHEETLATQREHVQDLEAEVHEQDSQQYEAVLERHRAVNEAEFAVESIEDDLATVEAEMDRVEDRLSDREELTDRRADLAAALDRQRTRIDRLEREVVETFNEHMADVLGLLAYENIERIWIERRERADADGSGDGPVFDLHVVRNSESGAVYEDTVDTLSESEREVAGLVFALAGYLAHEVYETVPFVLLDSLEAIDSERIGALVEYFHEYAPYLVVALLAEDSAAVDETHQRIRMTD
jgi:DNA repair exonuclease SbcCD ATPase subunit